MYSNLNINWYPGLCGTLLSLCLLSLAGCEVSGQQETKTQIHSPEQINPSNAITLNSTEVFRVSLEKALVRPDMSGNERTWNEAFMVRIGMTEPPAMGPALDIFLGDDRITEYGSWEGGIYFWIYDPAKLESLEGRTVSYQFDRSERAEIGTLLLGDQEQFLFVPEAELRNR